MKKLTALAALNLLIAACGAETMIVDPPPPPPPEEAPVVRPEAVDALTIAVQTHTLPAGLADDPGLQIATLAGVTTLVGGQAGLYELSTGGVAQIDATPVTALVALDGIGVVVGSTSGVSLWNGTLEPSPLSDVLNAMEIRALTTRDEELWIGTNEDLHLFVDGELSAFTQLTNTARVETFSGSEALLVAGMDGNIDAVREEALGFTAQSLNDERNVDAAVPAKGGRTLALDAGALVERINIDGRQVVWRPVALELGEDSQGATNLDRLLVDPIDGLAWSFGTSIARIDGARISVLETPQEMGPAIAASITHDGALWISDGTSLRRFGNEGPPATFTDTIAQFSRDNCERCHSDLGVGHPIDNYEAWVAEVDMIIAQLDAETMPQDGAALVGGSVELVRRWKADGLRR